MDNMQTEVFMKQLNSVLGDQWVGARALSVYKPEDDSHHIYIYTESSSLPKDDTGEDGLLGIQFRVPQATMSSLKADKVARIAVRAFSNYETNVVKTGISQRR